MIVDEVGSEPAAFALLRAEIEAQLQRYMTLDAGCPARLAEAMRYSLLSGGKRLRPSLVLMAAEAAGGARQTAMPAACAVEMIHTYSLVHDDLPAMDDDMLRRGRPTCHVQFDEATAILVGDALIPLAFEIICRDIKDPQIAIQCCAALAEAAGAGNLVGGQVDDLYWEPGTGDDGALLESIHLRKTAALLAVSLRLGGLTAGANQDALAALEQSGKYLGLAFQIADDLLDIGGDPIKMGKAARKDQQRGKLTYPGLWGVAESRQRLTELTNAAIDCWAMFGEKARPLMDLADYLTRRSH